MKFLLKSTLALLLLSTAATAQVRFGVEAGTNISKFKLGGDSGSGTTQSSKIGIRAGAIADIGIGEHFAIQPGILFSQRGGKEKVDAGPFGSFESETTVNYIEIPVYVLYKFDAGPGRVFAGLGPDLGYALSGKVKVDGLGEQDVEFGSDSTQAKRINFCANFVAGYELNMGVFIRAGYSLGLSNIANSDPSVKNNAIILSVGYIFGGRKD